MGCIGLGLNMVVMSFLHGTELLLFMSSVVSTCLIIWQADIFQKPTTTAITQTIPKPSTSRNKLQFAVPALVHPNPAPGD